MNEDIDNDKDYQIMELKQRISYYEPYKQKYEDLKEDWKYIKSLLDKEFNERTRLKKENEQLRTQLAICQQSKKDDGRFQVWEVPPISKGTRISFTTNNDGDEV